MREIPKFINELAVELNKNNMPFRQYLTEKNTEFENLVKPYLI